MKTLTRKSLGLAVAAALAAVMVFALAAPASADDGAQLCREYDGPFIRDLVPPDVRAPHLVEVGDTLRPLPGAGSGSPSEIAVRLQWSATDLSGIREFQLEKSFRNFQWWQPLQGFSSVTGCNANEQIGSITLGLSAPDDYYTFRVRAVDNFGNTSDWAYSGAIGAYDEDWPLVSYKFSTSQQWFAPWNTDTYKYHLGGSRKFTKPSGQASFSFRGRYVAWVGTVHPNGATAEVSLDGTFVETVSQHHPTIRYLRRVLFTRSFPQEGQHTLTIRNADGLPGSGEVDIDAFVVDTGS